MELSWRTAGPTFTDKETEAQKDKEDLPKVAVQLGSNRARTKS